MDIYLTNLSTGERLRFPLLPDRLSVSTGASVLSFNVIGTGEHKFPRGVTCTGYSWNGVFPGAAMSGMRFVHDWQKPTSIIHLLENWESRGDTLRLMVTELSINADVFIQTFNYDHYGVDDVSYSITLAIKRQLIISTAPAPEKVEKPEEETEEETEQTSPNHDDRYNTKSDGSGNKLNGYNPNTGGTSSGGSYTVKAGDTLMSIAKKQLGDATRFIEIYNLNKSAIDAANAGKTTSKYTVYPGMTLRLPAKSSPSTPASSAVAAAAAGAVAGAVAAAAGAIKSTVSTVQSIVSKLPSAKVVNVSVNAPRKVTKPAGGAFSKILMKAKD